MEGEDALLTLTELYNQMKTLGFDLSYFRFVIIMYFNTYLGYLLYYGHYTPNYLLPTYVHRNKI